MKIKLIIQDKEIEKEIEAEIADSVADVLLDKKVKRRRAEKGEYYFSVGIYGVVCRETENEHPIDDFNYSMGNYYQTEQEAEEALKSGWVAKRQAEVRIQDYIRENGLEFEPDWGNVEQVKYHLYYNYAQNRLSISGAHTVKYSLLPHFSCNEHGEQVIRDCEADLKILFGIK